MKIYPVSSSYANSNINKTPLNIQKNENSEISNREHNHNFNDHMLLFTARVPKDIERFYNVNKDRMPVTVKEYIDSLDSKEDISPMEAQRKAFEYLELADTVKDIKNTYPNEPMFENLKNPEDTRATKGILYTMRSYKPIYDSFLKNNENFTVYLVKKIFLENKTIEEINDDLDEDLIDDIKVEFKHNNNKSEYVLPGTIKALGIKTPDLEYRTSLRYTVDGYSDRVGDEIRKALKKFWDSLPPQERTARNRKSVRNFENWWDTLSHAKKLEMIADKQNELDLLKQYKTDTQKTSNSKRNSSPQEDATIDPQTTNKTKVGSGKLSQDDLFKIWAKMNLEIYQQSLSESDKETIQVIRSEKQAERWQEMSSEQKTAFIEQLKIGLERHRYAMIDAWNNSFDIIKDLSAFLIAKQIYKPANFLYSSEQFSEFQSRIMNEFWETHPEHAKKLGDNIRKSQAKIKDAFKNGKLAQLKREIDRQRDIRIRDLEKLKLDEKIKAGTYESDFMPGYMKEFRDLYEKECGQMMKYLPRTYNEDYFKIIRDNFSEKHVKTWTKNLLRQPLTDEDKQILNEIMHTEPLESKYNNRALEGALADTLYCCTNHPIVYSLSFSDLKVALAQIARKENQICIYSTSLRRSVSLEIKNYKIDKNRIESSYNSYKKPLLDEEIKNIAEYYFSSADGKYENLVDYLRTYGSSLSIVFSNKSVYPSDVKYEMINRIMNNMPDKIRDNYDCHFNSEEIIIVYDALKRGIYENYNDKFIPELFIADMLSGMQKSLIRKSVAEILAIRKHGAISIADTLILNADSDTKLKYLAMEKVLADIMYEITGDKKVYLLGLSALCDGIKLIQNTKKSATIPPISAKMEDNTEVELNLKIKRRFPITKFDITKRYREYLEDIYSRRNDYIQNWDIDELVCALNPDENSPEIDYAIKKRINKIRLNFER